MHVEVALVRGEFEKVVAQRVNGEVHDLLERAVGFLGPRAQCVLALVRRFERDDEIAVVESAQRRGRRVGEPSAEPGDGPVDAERADLLNCVEDFPDVLLPEVDGDE